MEDSLWIRYYTQPDAMATKSGEQQQQQNER